MKQTSVSFFLLITAVLGIAPRLAHAAGSTAANFLKIGVGARGAAMGEAQSAVAEDVTASYWNPAGLSGLRFQELSLMHYGLVDGIRYQQASYGYPTQNRGTFVAGVSLLDYGDIQGYDSGALPTGSLSASHLLFSGSWARRVTPKSKLSAGLTVKYLKSELAGFQADAPMADIGVRFPFESDRLRGLTIAAALRNLGSEVTYDTSGSPLPQQTVVGAGVRALGGNLNIALDFIKSRDEKSHFATGVEYRVFEMLNLRVGYNGLSDFVGNGITYGMGLKFTQWNFDYAFVPFGDLGNTNRVSVGVRFGRAVQLQQAADQIDLSYQNARHALALGRGVEAYSMVNDLLLIAPWHKPSVELKAKIEKQFGEMALSKNKARMEAEIADKFTEAKTAFDRDELVQAKKGFETVLLLQPEHVGSKVYLERIQNRYAALATESFKEGMAYFAAGDYAKAKSAFEKTLTIDATHVDARAQLERTNQLIADSTKREEEMKRLAGAEAAYKEGLAAYQRNDMEEALKKFEEVKTAMPEYEEVGRYYDLTKKTLAGVLFEESQVHFQNGQLEQAVTKLRRAVELAPDDARLKPALDVAERDLSSKRVQESKDLYKQGLEAYLGGDTEKAEKLWRQSLELDKENEDALKAIIKLEEQKKNAPKE